MKKAHRRALIKRTLPAIYFLSLVWSLLHPNIRHILAFSPGIATIPNLEQEKQTKNEIELQCMYTYISVGITLLYVSHNGLVALLK